MNIKSFLKTVGIGLISSHPLGAAAIGLINSALPDDEKLPENVTGQQAQSAIAQLPPGELVKLEIAELHLEEIIEQGFTDRYTAMCAADGQETRAKIVIRAMNALIWITVIFMSAVAYVYSTEGAGVAFSYPMMGVYAAVSGTFAYVIRAYFGDLKSETKSRHQTVDEKPSKPGLLELFLNRK